MRAHRQQADHRATDDLPAFKRQFLELVVDAQQLVLGKLDQRAQVVGRLQSGQGRDDHLARDIAGRMSAHAVGDRPDAGFGAIQPGVFVHLSNQTDVGLCKGLPAHAGLSDARHRGGSRD